MRHDSFKFRQFTIHQDRCAMKVGTDGTLLGAWASAPDGACRILDIGTGTGLIALMMAQRFPEASVIGIDIDSEAVLQASENANSSPFSSRVSFQQMDVNEFESAPFDAIVSNPPYFMSSLECPDMKRTMARHTSSLSYSELMKAAYRLLNDTGRFSLIIPSEFSKQIVSEAFLNGFNMSRKYDIKTTPKKLPKRCLLEFIKYPVNQLDIKNYSILDENAERSEWYHNLVKYFYIK